MSRLLICSESETILARVERICSSIGWDAERSGFDLSVHKRIAAKEADAVLFDLSIDPDSAERVVKTVTDALPFFPLLFLYSGVLPTPAEGTGFVYSIAPERLDQLEHVLISLSCAGFPASEIPPWRDDVQTPVPRVLIVDDDSNLAYELGHLLRAVEQYDVEVANSGFEAGALLHGFKPDVAIIDISLGDMDGREVCTFLRTHERFRDTKIIAVSGYYQPDEAEDAPACFDSFMPKPLSVQDLLGHVRAFLSAE
ncbi:MAG TPA: response regulator [Candidatus Hydrogenedentes bacterium]|nr:response regulator [Candidatus Hydrogenedentota bacterium]